MYCTWNNFYWKPFGSSSLFSMVENVLSNSCLEALFYKLNRWALWIWIFLRFLLHIDNSSSWNGGSVSITPTSALTSSSVLGYGGNGKRLDYTVDLWTTRCELCGFTYTQSFFNKYCKPMSLPNNLNNISFPLTYLTVKIQYIIPTTYKLFIDCFCYW